MRLVGIALAALVAFTAPVFAQDWIEYTSREEMFRINFPEQPKIEDVSMESEYGTTLPGKKFTANRGDNHYSVIVWNYLDAEVTDTRGSFAYAAHLFRERELAQNSKLTYDAYAQIDRIEGHQLQFTRPNGRRIFIAIHLHKSRLYVIEADVAAGQPPPAVFQAAMSMLDAEGNTVRYNIDADGTRTRAGGGGAGGGGAGGAGGRGAGAGGGRGAGAGGGN